MTEINMSKEQYAKLDSKIRNSQQYDVNETGHVSVTGLLVDGKELYVARLYRNGSEQGIHFCNKKMPKVQ